MKAFIRKADLSRDRVEQRPERFAVGDKVDALVTAFDKAGRKVSLSIKALEMREEKEAVEQYGSADSRRLAGRHPRRGPGAGRKTTRRSRLSHPTNEAPPRKRGRFVLRAAAMVSDFLRASRQLQCPPEFPVFQLASAENSRRDNRQKTLVFTAA